MSAQACSSRGRMWEGRGRREKGRTEVWGAVVGRPKRVGTCADARQG